VAKLEGQELVVESNLVFTELAGQVAPRPGQYFALTRMIRSGVDRRTPNPVSQ
jgi:hypothetical protein